MHIKTSVRLLTYNHGPYIAQAIESVLMQEVNFPIEIVIGDDCSTDNTTQIVQDYRDRFPDKIRLLDRPNKLGRMRNFVDTFQACVGEYVALLDGDDYWSSPHKLQKQTDFLDSHPSIAVCFHGIDRIYIDNSNASTIHRPPPLKSTYLLQDLLERNPISTCSTLCRNGLIAEFPPWFYQAPLADWPLHVLNAHHGDIGYLSEVMAVHRTHSGGVWSPASGAQRLEKSIELFKLLRENLNPEYHTKLDESIARFHFKILRAFSLQKDYRGMLAHAWKMVLQRDMALPALVKGGVWALGRVGSQKKP